MSNLPDVKDYFDFLKCTVCHELFREKIFLCERGHSFCKPCREILGKQKETNMCPECRGKFTGAENYTLQRGIEQLIDLWKSVSKKSDTAGPSDSSCHEIVVAKLAESLPALVKSLSEFEKNDNGSPQPFNDPESDPVIDTAPRIPLQPRGVFSCRICENEELSEISDTYEVIGKALRVPICRMVNHLLTFHKEDFFEAPLPDGNPEFTKTYEFDCKNLCRAIRVHQYGVFFFIMRVYRNHGKTYIGSWVQGVYPSSNCTLFTFEQKMRIRNDVARYSDYTFGQNSSVRYILENKHCLYYETEMTPNDIGKIVVDVKILRSGQEHEHEGRRNTTEVEDVSNQ
ncbi:uncharacterized protein LOC116347725 [Contarinia nasturtii]|uniref:uncharacterized protein LOC116347725 n=1 Tax=Contarinia nasturtii TaxID=265458 RepID=UPI0012D3ECF6|nr:uncharacterized protein LOC116347725 [Contarinia nasturtii]